MPAARRVGAEAQAEMLTDADPVALGMIVAATTTAEVAVHAPVLDHQTADTIDHMATVAIDRKSVV